MKAFNLLLLLFLSFCLSCSNQSQEGDSRPPNIIFLLTDDQRWDAMGAMGNPIIKTPYMDVMAKEGVLFRNAYVTTPICCTSRASILSGQYARRHQIQNFSTSFSDEAWQNCYPPQLKQAGYYLGFIGKFGVGRGPDMPAGDFDYWKGIPGQPKYEHRDSQGNYIHLTSILGDQCLDFLQKAPRDQPFCLSVSFKAPHVQDEDPRQFLYDSAYIKLYQQTQIPEPKLADAFKSKPDFFQKDNEARRRWDVRFSTPEKYQNSVKGYYRLVYGIDVVLGRIRMELKNQGYDENTIIVLMGDNGFFLGERGLAGKWYAYEESIRVPLIIYDPRLPAEKKGQILEQIALNIDLAPTFLSMAGLEIPETMQGRNLSPLYQGRSDGWRTDFLFEHEFKHDRIPMSEGVISLTEKYFRYLPPAPPHDEWYDLKSDPNEAFDRTEDEAYDERVQKAKERLDELIEQAK